MAVLAPFCHLDALLATCLRHLLPETINLHEYQLDWEGYRTAIDGFLAIRTGCGQEAATEYETGSENASETPETDGMKGTEQEVKLDD